MSPRPKTTPPRDIERPIPPPLFYRDGRRLSEAERFGIPDVKPEEPAPLQAGTLPASSWRWYQVAACIAVPLLVLAYTLLSVGVIVGLGLLSAFVVAMAKPIR